MSWLTKYLGISAAQSDELGEGVEDVKTITEFLGDVAEKIPDLADQADDLLKRFPDLLGDAIDASAPWLTAVGQALGEAVPFVKAFLSVASLVTRETDPNVLGIIALSLSYQAALADAAQSIATDPDLRKRISRPVSFRKLADFPGQPDKPEDFAGFQIESALRHPLVRRADEAVTAIAAAAGYPEDLRRLLLEGVHSRLAEKFRILISDGRTKEKFDPLFRRLNLGGKEVATYSMIRRHMEYQQWRFTRAPALGKAGALSLNCPLEQIFVPLDCGALKWGEIRSASRPRTPHGARPSPFDEAFGGRTSLLTKVMRLLGDSELNDAIVVQGTAGAGKSAFTLQLCVALRKNGLRPLRIRMRDLSLDPRISLMEDVAVALSQNSGDDVFDATVGPRLSATDVDLAHIFNESVTFGDSTICPYVVIFDGWDEISVSASEGFRIRIEKTLDAIRRQMLSGYSSHRVRVVLTGRPSDDVNEAKFLTDGTPILTVRPFTKPQLEVFVKNLIHHGINLSEAQKLSAGVGKRAEVLIRQFDEDSEDPDPAARSILGLPLLALLAVWLVLNDKDAPDEVATERTILYRRLVELTTRHGGNVDELSPTAPKITREELRALLQRTAAAMTLRGTEHISYDELSLRLEMLGLNDVERVVGAADCANDIAKLMLSFFFNTGNREHGCEFIHKSFREYLFAESIIEALKRAASLDDKLPSRVVYWKEFDQGDRRGAVVEELGLLLGPQWLSPEVWKHIASLTAWEIARAVEREPGKQRPEETPSLSLAGWMTVRDCLVSLWDWWAEGVHLRLQPYRPRGESHIKFERPYAVRLAEQISPPEVSRGSLPEPVRTTTLDAHLGDALFRLNCLLHFTINKATGWLDERPDSPAGRAASLWEGAGSDAGAKRKYQTLIKQGDRTWVVFAPASPDGVNDYLESYMHRINAAGWYPAERFPFDVDMSGVDLRDVELHGLLFYQGTFDYSRLIDADLELSCFINCSFWRVAARLSSWEACRLIDSDFRDADLANASFDGCCIDEDTERNAPPLKGAVVLRSEIELQDVEAQEIDSDYTE
jgi:uncharacterized protein YjbI with pentapeptide repeats